MSTPQRPIAILVSCVTLEQLEVAERYIQLWRRRYEPDCRNAFLWAGSIVKMRRLIRGENKKAGLIQESGL